MGISADAIWGLAELLNREIDTRDDVSNAMVSRIDVDGKAWVRLDGSSMDTPVNGGTRVTIAQNDAVLVSIKNGVCTITNNRTHPNATSSDISTVNVSVNQLDEKTMQNFAAVNGVIENLEVDTAKIHSLSGDQLAFTVGVFDNLTAEEFDANKMSALVGFFTTLTVEKEVTAEKISATTGFYDNLTAKEVNADKISSGIGFYDELTAKELNADKISAGVGFYDQLTAKELNADKLAATTGYVDDLVADNVTANKIVAATGYIDDLTTKNVTTENISAATAFVGDLYANSITTEDIEAATGYIDQLTTNNVTASNIQAATAFIDDLDAENVTAADIAANKATIDELDSNYAHITHLDANTAVIDNATIDQAKVNNLSTNYAAINLANVNNAWVKNGVIDTAAIVDEQVFTVTGNKATITEINADEITVRNLNAKNLKIETADGYVTIGDKKTPTKEFIDSLVDDIQDKIDSTVETFTSSAVPLTSNYPANQWTTDDERLTHVGDICFVTNSAAAENGFCYRYAYDSTNQTFSWVLIKDNDVTKALGDISDLKTFQSDTNTWIDETDSGLRTIRENHTTLSGIVDKTVKASTQLWFTKANTTAPNAPTAQVTTNNAATANAWNLAVPSYNATYPNYFYCWQYQYADGTYGWSAVIRDVAMGESQERARTAITNAAAADTKAGNAQSTANANIKSSVQLWYTSNSTTPPAKPTAKVTSTATTANAWTNVVPTYSSSTPYYHYCYQQQLGNGNWQWTDPTYDSATSIAMKKAQEALPSSTFSTFQTTTFKELVDEVDEQSSTITTLSEATEGLSTDFANLSIGGRNLLMDTRFFGDRAWTNSSGASINDGVITYGANDVANRLVRVAVNPADVLSLSFDIRSDVERTYSGDDICPILLDFSSGDTYARVTYEWLSNIAAFSVSNEWNRLKFTFTIPDISTITSVYVSLRNSINDPYQIRLMKLERGNKATDWTPAPEDMATSASVTTLSNTVNTVKQTADSNIAKITNLTTTLGTNADGTTNVLDVVHRTSAVEQNLEGITSRVGAVESRNSLRLKLRRDNWDSSTWATYSAVGFTSSFGNDNRYKSSVVSTGFDAKTLVVGDLVVIEGTDTDKGATHVITCKVTAVPSSSTAAIPLETIGADDNTALADRMTTAETTITQNSESIALKANASDTYTKQEANAILEVKANKDTLTSEINASADTVKINANKVNIAGAAIFTEGRLSESSLNDAYDAKGSAASVQSNLDNLQVGGRNLFKFSKTLPTSCWTYDNAWLSDGVATIAGTGQENTRIYQMPAQSYFNAFVIGETYTASIDAKGTSESSLMEFTAVGANRQKKRVALTTSWKRYSFTFTVPNGSDCTASMSFYNVGSDNISVRFPKIEKGNRATDWTPAPEDVDANANSREQTIYRSAADGTSSLPSNTTWVTASGDTQNAWTTRRPTYDKSYPVLFVAQQRQTVAQSTGTTCSCTTPTIDTTTTVIDGGRIITGSVTANKLDAQDINASNMLTVGSFTNDTSASILNSNISVGGRNLLINTGNLSLDTFRRNQISSIEGGKSDPDGSNSAYLITPVDNTWYLLFTYNRLSDVGETYTFSVWLRADTETTCNLCVRRLTSSYPYTNDASRKTVTVTTNWQRFSLTGVLSGAQDGDNCWIGQKTDVPIYVYHPKVERGNVATDWQPAPEDQTAYVDNLQIGGRNLIKNSGAPLRVPMNGTATGTYVFEEFSLYGLPFKQDEVFTLSGSVAVNSGTCTGVSARFFNSTHQTNYHVENYMPIIDGRITWTFTVSSELAGKTDVRLLLYAGKADSTTGNVVTYTNMKLERGDKATDWTLAPEDVSATTVMRTQRIYYRSNVNAKPTAMPAAWVTEVGNKYNSNATTASGWSAKVTPMTSSVESTAKYPYLWTCEQREMANGAIAYTNVLLDDTTTIIDGGNIITGSITANSINSTSINNSGLLTIGSLSSAAQSSVLNSAMHVGGTNMISNRVENWSSGNWRIPAVGEQTSIDEDFGGRISLKRPIPVEPNETYWVRLYGTDSSYVLVRSLDVNGGYISTTVALSNHAYTAPSNCTSGVVTIYENVTLDDIANGTIRVKFERGNVATDWSPAPEDQSEYADSVVDGLSISSTNLIRNGDFSNGTAYWVIAGPSATIEADSAYGKHMKIVTSAAGNGGMRVYPSVDTNFTHVIGEKYSISFYAKADAENAILVSRGGVDFASDAYLRYATIDTTWKRYTATVTAVDSGSVSFLLKNAGTLYLARVMLVRGDKPIDWSPDPRDVNEEFSNRMIKKVIATVSDFNDYTTTGIYYFSVANNNNAPLTNNGKLTVNFDQGTPNQIFEPDNLSYYYKRTYNKSSSVWSAWTKVDAVGAQTTADAANSKLVAFRGTCSTAAGTAAKVVACEGFALSQGYSITVYNTTAQTVAGAITLNVNSLGAKAVWVAGASTSDTNRLYWSAGSSVTFVYDGTQFRVSGNPGSYYGTTCSVAETTAAKTTTVNDSVIFKGVAVSVPMTNTNTAASPTLNVSALGACNIYYGTSTTGPTKANGYAWPAGTEIIFIFDGKFWRCGNQTFINGGNILTGTITADKLNVNDINAKNLFTIGALSTSTQNSILNSSIQVGSRNLLLGTKTTHSHTLPAVSAGNYTLGDPYAMVKSYSNLGLTTSDYLTISFDWTATNAPANATVTVGTDATPWEYFGGVIIFAAGSSSGHVSKSYKVTSALASCTGTHLRYRIDAVGNAIPNTMVFTMSNVKLEKGNKATDWTPAPEDVSADSVKRTQRIYYRSNVNTKPTAMPTAWVTEVGNKYNTNATTTSGWSTKITPVSSGVDSSSKYIYLWTCEQREMANGTIAYTNVLLDDSMTVIDGGNIATGTVTANKLNASDINAKNLLTIGALSTSTQDSILNSNVRIGGRNLLLDTATFGPKAWTNSAGTTISNGVVTYGDNNTENRMCRVLVSPNEMLSLSFDIRSDTPRTVGSGFDVILIDYSTGSGYSRVTYANIADIKPFSITADWARLSFQFKVPQNNDINAVYISLRNNVSNAPYQLRRIKLERGTTATDWTPAPEDVSANAVKRTQRIYYRSNVNTAPSTPSAWVTETGNKYNTNATTTAGWSTKVTPLTSSVDSTTKYIYLWTCEQREMADGTIAYTSVLLDDSMTVIDGGNIATGTITANKLNANDINAKNLLTIGALSTSTQNSILNSNVKVGGRNLLPQTAFKSISKWENAGGSASINTSVLHSGNNSVKLVGPTGGRFTVKSDYYQQYTTGTVLTMSLWMMSPDVSKITEDVVFYVAFRDSGKSPCGAVSRVVTMSTFTNAGNNNWFYVEFTVSNENSLSRYTTFIVESYQMSATIYLSDLKLEIGNKATDWTPAPEDVSADSVNRTQRIYYRSNVNTKPTAMPTAWVTETGNKYNTNATTAIGWSTKVTPISSGVDSSTRYIYLWTCEQREMADGTIAYTNVLLDDSMTVIDGGNIATGTITANKLNVNDINAKKSLTIGALSDGTQSSILNSNMKVSSTNLIRNGDFSNGGSYWYPEGVSLSVVDDSTYGKCAKVVTTSAGGGGMRLYPTVPENFTHANGETYSFSCYAKADADNQLMVSRVVGDQPYVANTPITTSWKRFTGTITSNGTGSLTFLLKNSGTLYLTRVMLVHGDKPMDWSPDPRDISSGLADAAKTATNYITYANATDGIKVTYNGTNAATQITSSGVNIINSNNASVASFGETVRVGVESKYNTTFSSNQLSMNKGTASIFKITTNSSNSTFKVIETFYINQSGGASSRSNFWLSYAPTSIASVMYIPQDTSKWSTTSNWSDYSSVTLPSSMYSLSDVYDDATRITGKRRNVTITGSSSYPSLLGYVAIGYNINLSSSPSLNFGVGTAAYTYGAALGIGCDSLAPASITAGAGSCAGADHAGTNSLGTSVAIGRMAVADPGYAIGNNVHAIGEGAVALGYVTKAVGQGSFASGGGSAAVAPYSTAMGYSTFAKYSYQTVIGEYNIGTTGLFIIGDGSNDSSRANRLTLDSGGDLWISGTLTQNSDRRLKTHHAYLGKEASTFMRKLRPALFTKDGERHLGFYAQDVQDAEPENWDTVTVRPEHTDESLDFDPLTLDYTALIAPLTAYAQQLEKRIEYLESTVDSLVESNEELREMVETLIGERI